MEVKKRYFLLFLVFLILFAIFSQKIIFHDSQEYITFAKNFAGIENVDLFSTHSILYPFVISFFLKIWPSVTMLKLVNVLWVFLISLVLFFWIKNKLVFILFVFSPLTWLVSIQTTPVLPASLFFLLSFIFLKKEHIKYNKIYSGIFMGLAYAFYDPVIFLMVIFFFSYFWDQKIYRAVPFILGIVIGILPRLFLDFWIFGMPFYSIIRFFGTNMIISLGLYPGTTNYELLTHLEALLIVFVISPLLFRLHRIKFKEYKKDFFFFGIGGFLLLFRTGGFKYFLLLSPMLLIFLGAVLTKKEMKISCLVSLIIIVILTYPFFIDHSEKNITEDVQAVLNEFNQTSYLITGVYEANELASLFWENEPYFVWYEDYAAMKENRSSLRGYEFPFNSILNLRDQLVISADFRRANNRTYENALFISRRGEIPGLKQVKCYKVICLYEELK